MLPSEAADIPILLHNHSWKLCVSQNFTLHFAELIFQLDFSIVAPAMDCLSQATPHCAVLWRSGVPAKFKEKPCWKGTRGPPNHIPRDFSALTRLRTYESKICASSRIFPCVVLESISHAAVREAEKCHAAQDFDPGLGGYPPSARMGYKRSSSTGMSLEWRSADFGNKEVPVDGNSQLKFKNGCRFQTNDEFQGYG